MIDGKSSGSFFAHSKAKWITGLILVGCLSTYLVAQSSSEVDWRTATSFPKISFSGLSSYQQAEVVRRLRVGNCPCGCEMKLAECLIDDPTCPKSPGLAREIVADVRETVPRTRPKVNWRTATSFPNISFQGLSSRQRSQVIQELRVSDCPCGCGMKLAECLIDDPTCPESPGLARAVVSKYENNFNSPSIQRSRLSRVHIVTFSDSQDPNIGRHCAADEGNIRELLIDNIDPKRLAYPNVDVYKLRSENVLNQIANLRIQPDDTIFFYFSGHGGYNNELGQFFYMSDSKSLLQRRAVRAAIKKHNPRLGILITDCCYGFTQPGPGVAAAIPNDITKPLMDELFFKESGFVDITSSKRDQLSFTFGEDDYGSIFTVAFLKVCYPRMDRRLSWKQIFNITTAETETLFQQMYPGGIRAGQFPGLQAQPSQTPFAFSLGNSFLKLGMTGSSGSGGVLVSSVTKGLPFDEAGIKQGDVIVAVDGRLTPTFTNFSDEIDEAEETILVDVRRGKVGAIEQVKVRPRF